MEDPIVSREQYVAFAKFVVQQLRPRYTLDDDGGRSHSSICIEHLAAFELLSCGCASPKHLYNEPKFMVIGNPVILEQSHVRNTPDLWDRGSIIYMVYTHGIPPDFRGGVHLFT